MMYGGWVILEKCWWVGGSLLYYSLYFYLSPKYAWWKVFKISRKKRNLKWYAYENPLPVVRVCTCTLLVGLTNIAQATVNYTFVAFLMFFNYF